MPQGGGKGYDPFNLVHYCSKGRDRISSSGGCLLTFGVDKTPPSPVLPEGITTGSMGNSNLKAGVPAVAKGTTGSPIVEMGAALFGNTNPLKSKGSLEPVKTEVTKLNKIEPVVTLEIIR